MAISRDIPTLSTDGSGGFSGGSISGDMASQIVAQSQSFGSIDIGAVNSALSGLGGQDAALAGAVQSEISAGLTPVEQGQLAAEVDIVVTAQSRPVSDAEIAAYDQANQERPTHTVAFATTAQLDVAEQQFHAEQARTGPMLGDEQTQANFDAYRAELEGREQVAYAIADREAFDVLKSGIPILETPAALYRVGVNGEFNFENGIAIAGAAAGGVLGVAGKGGAIAAEVSSSPVVFDGAFATQQILGGTTTPAGREVMLHAADRMVNPPAGRAAMSAADVDAVLDGATSVVKRSNHPDGATLTIENANMAGKPRVVVDEATGQRIITVINPRQR